MSDRELDMERKEDGTFEAPKPHSILAGMSLFERMVMGVGIAGGALYFGLGIVLLTSG